MTENIYFNLVQEKTQELLAKKDFTAAPATEENGVYTVWFAKEDSEKLAVQYNKNECKFKLLRSEGDNEPYALQVYLFDEAAGDGEPQASSVANEFADAIEQLNKVPTARQRAVAAANSAATRKVKEKENDETGSLFFVNRIPGVLPEVKEPLIAHKAFYGQLLPNRFCEECVCVALANLLAEKNYSKLDKFLDFLSGMYHNGDTDVKSIITMTVLNSVTGEDNIAEVEKMLSDELKKAWPAARKLIGKTFTPEKDTLSQKMFKTMSQNATNSLR